MSQIQYMDELIREYLLFRGFSGTLKSFDAELKSDREKGFRVDKIVDQFMQYIYVYDLTSLKELWAHLDQKIFTKLENDCTPAVRKLENSLLKLYLITAVVNNKSDKVTEFFQKLTLELQGQAEWKDWFKKVNWKYYLDLVSYEKVQTQYKYLTYLSKFVQTEDEKSLHLTDASVSAEVPYLSDKDCDEAIVTVLPYIKNPEESYTFSVHFTRQWQDTLLVSLHNFLSIIYQAMPQSVLASYEDEAARIRRIQEENDSLKHRLAKLQQRSSIGAEVPPLSDLMDDFYIIAQETAIGSENQGKSLKSLIRTIGGGIPTSPIMGRKAHSSSHDQSHKRHSSKPRLTSAANTAWIKNVSGESGVVNKRSVSLEARSRNSRSGPREASLDRMSKTRQEFLLLSQEEINEHRTVITNCRFNATGSVIGSCDMDGVVKVWSPAPTPRILSSSTFKSSILCLEWVAKNERYFITGGRQGLISLYDTKEIKTVWEVIHEDKSKTMSISTSPTESTFVCACVNNQNQGKLLLYDIKTKKLESSLSLGPGGPNLTASCCKYNHNGQLLIAGCSDGTVRTLDLRHSECIDSWSAHQGAVQAMQLTPDQNACYTLGTDNKLYRHSLNQTKQPVWEASLSDGVSSFTLDQSGNHVLLCGQIGANIHQVTPAGLNLILQLCRSPIVSCDWANANQCGTCVTASADGRIKISTLLMP